MIKDTRYIIKRVIIGVLISLILSFIYACDVHALDLTDFDDLIYIDVYNSSQDVNTYPTESDNTSSMLYATHNYTFHTYANVSQYNYAIIPLNSAYWYIINRVCYWGSSANGFNYTAGGCSLESTMNFSYRFALKVDGITKPCAYDGAYAVCNVKDNQTITGYYLFLYYTIANINIGGSSANSSNTEFKFQSHAPTGIYLSKSKNSASAINDAIDREIQNNNQNTQDITSSIDDVNDTLKDDNVDDPSTSLSNMDSKIATNSVISDLLLLPVTLFQKVLNGINGTCSTFNLGSLLGTNLSLPCINLSNILGSTLYGVIDVLLCGIFVLSMRKKFVNIFENITSLKDRGNELE